MAPVIQIGLTPPQLVGATVCAAFLAVLWLKLIVLRLSPGYKRLVASSPVLAALLCSPILWDYNSQIVIRASLMFSAAWLGTFKVVAMCLDRGPLAQPLGVGQMATLLMLPIFTTDAGSEAQKGKGRLSDQAGSPGMLVLQGIAKTVMLAVVVFVAMDLPLPTLLHNYILAFGMCGFLGIIMDFPASILCSALGMKIIPTFDSPWLSTSLADFWGRRWNITTSSVLRTVIHDTIMEGQLVKRADSGAHAPPPTSADHHHPHHHNDHHRQHMHQEARRKRELRRVLGLMMTFFVSGVVHEIILCMLQDEYKGPWKFKWLAFFTTQAPFVVAELWLKRWWLQRKHYPALNPTLARLLTSLLLLSIATPLFFTPAEIETDTGPRMLAALQKGYKSLALPVVHFMSESSIVLTSWQREL